MGIEPAHKGIRVTTLPVDDYDGLLEALKGDVDPEDLRCVDQVRMQPEGSNRSVHAMALSHFMCANSDDEANKLEACCHLLVAKDAPLTDAYGDGAAAQFCGYPWPLVDSQFDQVVRLADHYVGAGLLDLNAPLGGVPLSRAERRELDGDNYEGVPPLAAAIFGDNTPLARYLLSRGASLELGHVHADDETGTNAVDLALSYKSMEVHALLVEAMMRGRLHQAVDSPATPVAAAPRARSRLV